MTDRARRVIVLAQEEARTLKHNYLGTEHLLLGLLREGEGIASKALTALGISLDGVRAQVEGIIGQGQQAPSGHIPMTPRAKKVLELSLREGLQLGHNYIGTEHILLGLIREGEGLASQVLVKLGGELPRVRRAVIEALMLHPTTVVEKPPVHPAADPVFKATEAPTQVNVQLVGGGGGGCAAKLSAPKDPVRDAYDHFLAASDRVDGAMEQLRIARHELGGAMLILGELYRDQHLHESKEDGA